MGESVYWLDSLRWELRHLPKRLQLWLRRGFVYLVPSRHCRELRRLRIDLDDEFVGGRGAAAAEALCAMNGPDAFAMLMDCMRSDNPEIVQTVAWALAEARRMDAVGPLMPLLRDERPWVRRCAAETLGRLGDPLAITALSQALDQFGFESEVAISLTRLGDRRAARLLLDRIFDDCGFNPGQYLEPLEEADLPEFRADVAMHRAIDDGNWSRVLELGQDAVEPLIDKIRRISGSFMDLSEDPIYDNAKNFLSASIRTLGEIGDPRAVDLLWDVVEQEMYGMIDAIDALRKIDPEGIESMIAHVEDPDWHGPKHLVISALAQGESQRAFKALTGWIGHEEEYLGVAACDALRGWSDSRIIDALTTAFDYPSDSERDVSWATHRPRWDAAASALNKLGETGERRLDRLRSTHENPEVREFLARCGDMSNTPEGS